MPRDASAPLIGRFGLSRTVLGLLALAVLVRLLAAVLVGGTQFRFVDEAIYTDAAAALRAGAPLSGTAADQPGYPALLALLDLLLPSGVLALRLGQAVVVALGTVLCFALGRRLGGEGAGVAAAGLYAVDPLLAVTAGLLYPEASAALLLTGGILVTWGAVRDARLGAAFAGGALLGAATLFRPMTLAMAPAVLVGTLGWSGRPVWRRGALAAALLVGWGVVLAPWGQRNLSVYGQVLPSGAPAVRNVHGIGREAEERGIPGAIVNAARRDPLAFAGRTIREFGGFWEFYPTRLATDYTARREGFSRKDPRLSAEPLVRRSARDLVSALSFGLELALACIGLVLGWRARRRETVWLVLLVLSFSLGYALFYGKLRYRIPVLPIVLAFAGWGTAAVTTRLRGRQSVEDTGRALSRSQ